MTTTQQLVDTIIEGIHEKKGRSVVTVNLQKIDTAPCAYFVICTGGSPQQVDAITDSVEEFARTRAAARQLVNHGHVLVNGKKVDIPSYLCSVNDVISFKGDSPLKVVKECIDAKLTPAAFVTVDAEKIQGTFARKPERNELPSEIQESQIIEYYNRKL